MGEGRKEEGKRDATHLIPNRSSLAALLSLFCAVVKLEDFALFDGAGGGRAVSRCKLAGKGGEEEKERDERRSR
jgi:hypothetical protein